MANSRLGHRAAALAIVLSALLTGEAFGAEAVFVGRYVIGDQRDWLGGLSGLELSGDGAGLIAISDRGRVLTGRVERRDGRITGVSLGALRRLRGPSGKMLSPRNSDAEGLAADPRGGIFVSFEGNHRVVRYPALGAPARTLRRHPDFKGFQSNSGLEALAIDRNGDLFALPERSGGKHRPFPVYRFHGGKWRHAFALPRRGDFLPVGADFGPDGRFYLLERDFSWFGTFASRIRSFSITAEGLGDEETLLVSGFGTYDNLEGVSVWRDAAGAIRITAISDDNFNVLQVTEIVEFRLQPWSKNGSD